MGQQTKDFGITDVNTDRQIHALYKNTRVSRAGRSTILLYFVEKSLFVEVTPEMRNEYEKEGLNMRKDIIAP